MNGHTIPSCLMTFGAVMPNWRFTDALEPHVPITEATTGRIARACDLSGLGGAGQMAFNPSLGS